MRLVALLFLLFFSNFAFGGMALREGCENLVSPRGEIIWENVDLRSLFTALQAEKVPLNFSGLKKNDAKVRAVTLQVLGKEVGFQSVWNSLNRLIKDWNKEVAGLGFDPFEGGVLYRGKIPPGKILEAIKALSDAERSVAANDLRDDESELSRAIIRRVTGVPISPNRLYQLAIGGLEGDWPQILDRAGVSAIENTKRSGRLTTLSDEKFLRIIKWLSWKIPDMSMGGFFRDSPWVQQITMERFKIPLISTGIFAEGVSRYGGWIETLEKAQVKNLEIYQRRAPLKWSKHKVIEVLQLIAPHFKVVTYGELNADPRKFEDICFNKFKRGVSVDALWKQIAVYFTSVKDALFEANVPNLDATIMAMKFEWNADTVRIMLEALKKYFTNFSEGYLYTERKHFREVMNYEFKRDITFEEFLEQAKLFYGSWDLALKRVEIDQ